MDQARDIYGSLLDNDEVPPESPSAVTPLNDVFTNTHFEGLEASADQLFGASQLSEPCIDKRMSISARFLSSSGYVPIYHLSLYNAHCWDPLFLYLLWISKTKHTVNGVRFAGLNFCGFHPMKFCTGKLSRCLTFKALKQCHHTKLV